MKKGKGVRAEAEAVEAPPKTDAVPDSPTPAAAPLPNPSPVIAVRMTGEQCAAIEAAYRGEMTKAQRDELGAVVHSMYLFGYRK